jgi:hypothetical protein
VSTAVLQVLVDTERDGHRVSFNEAFQQKGGFFSAQHTTVSHIWLQLNSDSSGSTMAASYQIHLPHNCC